MRRTYNYKLVEDIYVVTFDFEALIIGISSLLNLGTNLYIITY